MHDHTMRYGVPVSGARKDAPHGPRADEGPWVPGMKVSGDKPMPTITGGSPATMTNDDLLDRLEAAFKAVTDISTFGASILATDKFDQFVREARDSTTILPEARFIPMDAQKVEIDRIGFAGRILDAGRDDAGAHRSLGEGDFADPNTATNDLEAQELIAIASLRDAALRRNIERGGFEDTLVSLFSEAAGRDLEEYALLADTDWAAIDDLMLSKTDGWVKRAAQKVYGGASEDFDPADSESIFQAMLDSLPKRFLQDRSMWRFYVPFEVEDGYRDQLKGRGTQLGDETQTQNRPLSYKGIPVVYVPIIERAKTVASGGPGRVCLLSHPDNLAWGVFHEVTVEREREAKERRTDFVLTVEPDADYEDENGAVAAYLDQSP